MFDVLPGARVDMETLQQEDPAALAAVLAFLQEARGDRSFVDKATTHGNVEIGNLRVNVRGFVAARKDGHNLSRFRILDTPATNYRVIFGFDWHRQRIGILAIQKKADSLYELSTEIGERILYDWDVATGGRRT